MAFCAGCGTEMGTAAFCPKCGKPAAADAAPVAVTSAGGTGLAENVARLLCYAFGGITGVIFFAIDKRPFVRFHAMQSIITFVALMILQWVLAWWIGGLISWVVASGLSGLIGLATLACWIICMIKAYQGERFKLPVVGDMAEQYSK